MVTTLRVPTDLESQGKPGKNLLSGNFFYFSKKSGNIFLNAACHENKTYCDFPGKKVVIIISCSR